jgi:hypothetical protein
MKFFDKNKRVLRPHLVAAAFAALVAIALGTAGPAQAGRVTVVGNANADIRVWVDDTWDVYPSYDDVVISVRAARSCYATLYLVDTEGFIHVIHPFTPYDDAWIEAGVTYRYAGRDLGLGALSGRGVAFVFAVGSPYEFDYTAYGDGIFVGRYGFRVFGDPFVASRHLYVSILPSWCNWDFIGVGFARFYVREWARYPRYLCHGHHGAAVHVRAGTYCRSCYRVYDEYRSHVNDPYRVIRPASKYKTEFAGRTGIKRSTQAYKTKAQDRSRSNVMNRKYTRTVNKAKIVSAKRTSRTKTVVNKNRPIRQTKAKAAASAQYAKKAQKVKSYKSPGPSKSSRTSTAKGKVSPGKTRGTKSKAGASR